MKNFNVVIVGRPNVGKSSIFNRIINEKRAIVDNTAGTTRDILNKLVNIEGKCFNLIDTAGYFLNKKDEIHNKALEKVSEAIKEADLIIVVTDGGLIPTYEDEKIINVARKTGKRIFLVVNKIDNDQNSKFLDHYLGMGIRPTFAVSAIHNRGINELLAGIIKLAPSKTSLKEKERIFISIIGRPNVGKSSLLNHIVKKERAIVSNIPGTTRDVVEEVVLKKDKEYILKDTAGARRPGKIGKKYLKGDTIEKYANIRMTKEINKSDIVLLVLDANEGATAQDLHIAGSAKDRGRGIIIVINKWDLAQNTTQEEYLKSLRKTFNFMIWVPVIFVSAKTGYNVDYIFEVIEDVARNQRRQIPTSKLNRILEEFSQENVPKGRGTYKPKVFFISQTGIIPPEFTVSAKYYQKIHFSWKRALENELRRNFDFTGTPIKIYFKSR